MATREVDTRLISKAWPNHVFIIDDDTEIRATLRIVLESNGFRVNTFESALKFLSSGGASLTGCVLTDIEMPGMSGLELQAELKRRGSPVAIVAMAGAGIVRVAVLAMRAGAIDFLEKPFGEAALLEGVGRALESVSKAECTSSFAESTRARFELLTKREKEVLDLVVAGRSNKVAAHELHISPRTVEVHRARAASKMGARNLAELVRISMSGQPSQELTKSEYKHA